MRAWVIAMGLLALAGTARADDVAPIVHAAMPSGIHVERADTLERGAVVGFASGLGYRAGLLGDTHTLVRALGTVAGAVAVTPRLTVGLSLDGYYDRHTGVSTGASSGCGERCEQGYVGAPHLHARLAGRAGAAHLAAHLTVWVPGDQLPSVKLAATSLELRGVTTLEVGPGSLSLDAGLRVDNTDKANDDLAAFTVPDRVSYGASSYHAIVAGAHYAIAATPRLWIAGEASIVVFVGTPPMNAATLEDGRSLGRLGVSAGVALGGGWSAIAFLDAARSPGVLASQTLANQVPLIPYEPMLTGGLGVHARLGATPRTRARPIEDAVACWDTPRGCTPETTPLLGDLTGTVLDDEGRPLAGAIVTVRGKVTGVTASAQTNPDGSYIVAGVRIGTRVVTTGKNGPKTSETIDESELEMQIVAEGRDPITSSITTLAPGPIAVRPVTLKPTMLPGQVRGIVRTQTGKAIANAKLTVVPGEITAATGSDGMFSIDLPPGTYLVRVTAAGYHPQELTVTLDPNGVALKEFILAR